MANKEEYGNSLDLVNIKEIHDRTVIMKDGGMRQIVMVGGVNFALKSESEQNLITQGYQTFLNGVEFPLQIVVHSRKVNIDKYVARLLERKAEEGSALLQNQIDEYVEFVKGFVEKNAIMEKVFLLVVPFYPSIVVSAKVAKGFLPSFLGGGKKNVDDEKKDAAETEHVFYENLAQLNQRVSQAMTGLLSMGLEATVLEDDALVELFYNFYNPQTIERDDMTLPAEKQ